MHFSPVAPIALHWLFFFFLNYIKYFIGIIAETEVVGTIYLFILLFSFLSFFFFHFFFHLKFGFLEGREWLVFRLGEVFFGSYLCSQPSSPAPASYLSVQGCVLSLFLFLFVPSVNQTPTIIELMVSKEH